MVTIDYYFSVLSDWAYFGGERLEALARHHAAKINHMPIKLADVYAGTGGVLLQKRSQQRQAYRVVELERWRDALGIPITITPRYYPTNDDLASRAIIAVKRLGGDVGRFSNLVLRAIWVEDRDIADEKTLLAIAIGVGLDAKAVLTLAASEDVALELDRYTVEAQSRGVFGSPFYILGKEIFWGQDRLDFLEIELAKLSGREPSRSKIPQTPGRS
jgi:2-hydroxychromene-2-carboxylate isomerase